jgi:hypothetical protein
MSRRVKQIEWKGVCGYLQISIQYLDLKID